MMTIRHFTPGDYPMVEKWWKDAKELPPTPTMLPESSTFIIEADATPLLCITIYITNSPDIAYLEQFVGNPESRGQSRRDAAKLLVEYCCQWAKERGYKNLLCLARAERLKERYQDLGWTKTLDNVATFCRAL